MKTYALLAAALALAAASAHGQEKPLTVLRLNSVGDAGLERMLQIARHHAGTVEDDNMAVSLDHALYAARAEAAAEAAKQAQKQFDDLQAQAAMKDMATKAASDLKAKQDELDKANAEVARLKAVSVPSGGSCETIQGPERPIHPEGQTK